MRPPLAPRTGRRFRTDPLSVLRERSGHDRSAGEAAGGLIRFRAGASDFAVVADPAEIHRILVTDAADFGEGKWTVRGERVMGDCLITREGEPHARRRDAIQHHFERSRVAPHADSIVSRCERMVDRWPEGGRIELRSEMAQMALAAAAEVMFGAELEDRAPELVDALWVLLAEIPRPWMPAPRTLRLRRARAVVEPIVFELIASRRRDLEARAGSNGGAPGAEAAADLLTTLVTHRENGRGLSDARIADELVSLMIASIDTTPGTLAWACLELARRPELEAEVVSEIRDELGEEPAGADVLTRLPGLAAVVDETLRLHPPVHFIDRRPRSEVRIAGERVGRGTWVLVSPLLTQRDPRYYDDPDAFRPERWHGVDRRSRPRYSFFPFGGGPHTCIGMALARLELGLALATVLPRVSLSPDESLAGAGTQTGRFPMTVSRRAEAPPRSADGAGDRALVDGLIYADLFDCALTAEEAWRYAGRRAARREVAEALAGEGVGSVVSRRDGLHCLRGREELLETRREGRDRARRLERRGRRAARLLRHLPFVRGIYLTGSVAAGDAGPGDDVDMLVVCARGRLATVFVMLGSLSRLIGRRAFCPNHYVAEDALASRRRDAYVANEIARAVPLVAGPSLRAENGWIRDFVPNASVGPASAPGRARAHRRGRVVQSLLEAPLRGRLGRAAEARARPLAAARLRAHYAATGGEPPPEVSDGLTEGRELRFHAAPFSEAVPVRLAERTAEVEKMLAG